MSILLCFKCGSRYRLEDAVKHQCNPGDIPKENEEIKSDGSKINLGAI